MNAADTVGRYVREVERWTPGPATRQREITLELEAHLRDAESAGQLSEALNEFGSPREAARSLMSGRTPTPAPLWRRVLAVLIDDAIVVMIGTAGLPVSGLFGGTDQTVSVRINQVLFFPSLSCSPGPCSTVGSFAFFSMVIASAFFFVVVLTLVEWRYGRTPGKFLVGTRVVSEDGTAITIGQAVIRRLPFFFLGPLGTIDSAFVLFGPTRQRGFDRIARTLVVRDANQERGPR